MRSAANYPFPSLLVLFLVVRPLVAAEPSPKVRFGLPSAAKDDPKQREDFLIERPQYTLSYNAKARRPNWVSWVRHEVADVTVLQSEDRPTAPAVLPAVSYGTHVSATGRAKPPDNVASSAKRAAGARADAAIASINVIGRQDWVDRSTYVKQR
jgi:hypothetical protein